MAPRKKFSRRKNSVDSQHQGKGGKRRGRSRVAKNHGAKGHKGKKRELIRIEDEIIGFIYKQGGTADGKEISKNVFLPSRTMRRELVHILQALCHGGTLSCKDDNYSIEPNGDLVEAEFAATSKGYGFASTDKTTTGKKEKSKEDIFIPAPYTNTAINGDRILVRITGKSRGREEGRLVTILARAQSRIVGIYKGAGLVGQVIPEDERLGFLLTVQKKNACGAGNGDAVVAEILDFRLDTSKPEGRIIKVLGDPEDLQVQTDMVIYKFELPHVFSDKVLKQADKFTPAMTLTPERRDLRDIQHVTIDGETARDFDDAVAIEKTRKGYRLYVSIADVSHYVTPGSPIDREAYSRGTSVYFPNRVVPMLPERLSNELCSLVPDKDRLAFTAILDFDRQGNRVHKEFTRSLIRSHNRFTYTTVKEIVVDKNKQVRAAHKPFLSPLKGMVELALALEEKRMKRGSIGFEIPEAEIYIDDEDNIKSVARTQRNQAHKLIEEFMLAANEAVAETYDEYRAKVKPDFLYRIHEEPDLEKITEFSKFAATMGLNLPEESTSPKWFGRVLKMVEGSPKEYIINNLLLRVMKQARYAPENAGHFGLAASHYCHFTSPIRRYPDLMVHRALARMLTEQGKKSAKENFVYDSAEEAGEFLSKRERVAVDAEREMVNRLQVRYMADKVGEVFEGVISGVTSFVLFVELTTNFISGGIAVADLKDDSYRIDEKHHKAVGRGTGKIYQVGDLITVKVAGVDVAKRHINFVPVTEKDA